MDLLYLDDSIKYTTKPYDARYTSAASHSTLMIPIVDTTGCQTTSQSIF